jgi:imidazolonepropionase
VSDEGIAAMAKVPTFAVLLPTTAYILRLEHPPARKMIDAGTTLHGGLALLAFVFALADLH